MLVQNRRERLREATINEIKAVALHQMAQQGAAALSLRAIAGQMGMSAPALYNYYANRDELVTALIVDAYTSLAEAIEAACQTQPTHEYGLRFLAATLAFREWALSHREQFMLIYGSPIPGYHAPASVTTPVSIRATYEFMNTLESAWRAGKITIPPEYAGLTNTPTHQHIEEYHREQGLTMPAALLQIAIAGFGLIQGFVSLELYNHLDYLGGDVGEMYRAEVIAYLRRLGLLAK